MRSDLLEVSGRGLIHPQAVWGQFGGDLLSIVMIEHSPSGTCIGTMRLVVHEADSTKCSVSFLIGREVKQDPPGV